MNEFVTKRSLYHAKTGNFTGFCVSLSSDLNEDKLDELYDHFLEIRGKMSNTDEEKETWFTIAEFVEYQNNPENIRNTLYEVATIVTRMKLRRAAKKTSSRRARKRFIRRKIRKNRDQLKKRAYGQVKTLLRKRLSGGRPWSKLSLSTRARIDSSINKRKSILIRMVKTRLPKMATQETKRLQRVRLNSSYDPPLNRLILETKRGPSAKGSLAEDNETKKRKTKGAMLRQRKHRQKLEDNLSEFIKTVVVAKRGNKYELIEKESSNSKHTNIQNLSSIGQALSVCNKIETGEFRITETSKRLCGNIKKSNKRKGNSEMGSTNQSTDQNNQADLSMQPQIPYEDQPGDLDNLPKLFRDFSINPEYKPEALEIGVSLASRMNRSGNSQILEDIEDIQGLLSDTENITNDQVDMINEIHDRLMESGLSENEIQFLVSNKDLYTISNAQFNSACKTTDIEGNIIYRKIPGMGFNDDTMEDYAFVPLGRTSVGVVEEGLDGTSKADITLVHVPTVLAFLGKLNDKLTEKQINDLMTNHVHNMNVATGGVGDAKGKKSIAAESKESVKYFTDFQKWIDTDNKSVESERIREYRQNTLDSNFQSGMYGLTKKDGANRIGSSNVSGDALNTFREAHRRTIEGLSADEMKNEKVIELIKSYDTFLEEIKTGKVSAITITSTSDRANQNAQSSVAAVEATKQRLIKLIENMTSVENIKTPYFRKFTKELLRISLTGDGRIDRRSPGIATHIFASNGKNSPNATITIINDTFLESLLKELEKGKGKSDLIINFSLKSGSESSRLEKEYERKFDAHVQDIAGKLKNGEQLGNLTSKSTKRDIEDEIIGNIYSAYDKLDDNNGDRDALLAQLEKDGHDPKDITSELYLMQHDIRDKRYSLRIVLNIINNMESISKDSSQGPSTLSQSFSFNPLLNFLVEHYSVLKEENESGQTKESLKDELDHYLDNAKRSIGTGPDMLTNLIRFFEIDFDTFTDPVNFNDVLPKPNASKNSNTIFIGKKQIKVPISEYYANIGKMFLSEAKKRDYKEEYEDFHGKPEERKKRSKRVLARRLLSKMGKVRKGDGKDVDHKDGNAMNNSPSNLHAISAHKNRAKH